MLRLWQQIIKKGEHNKHFNPSKHGLKTYDNKEDTIMYEKVEDLLAELKGGCKEIGNDQARKFENLLNEFFKSSSPKSGLTSADIWNQINRIFENYFKKFYADMCIESFNDIVLQCRIDCFFADAIERYELNMVEEILASTRRLQLSDEIEDLLDEYWGNVEVISKEVAGYLVNKQVKLDNMSQVIGGYNKSSKYKFIDYPDIPKHDGLWIRVRIVVDENGKVKVYAIIVPKAENAVSFEITPACEEWIKTL